MNISRLGTRGAVIATAVVSLTGGLMLGGTAWSAVPDSGGVVHTCYSQANGTWRPIDYPSQKCKSGERLLDINQRGPAGPQGATGSAGPAGPAGPAGADGSLGSLDDLEGKSCNTASVDFAGRVHVTYDNSLQGGHLVTLSCQPVKKVLTVRAAPGRYVYVDDEGRTAYYEGGDGSVTVSPPGETLTSPSETTFFFAPGTTVTLTAQPEPGSTGGFSDPRCGGNSTTCTLTITEDTSIDASFMYIPT